MSIGGLAVLAAMGMLAHDAGGTAAQGTKQEASAWEVRGQRSGIHRARTTVVRNEKALAALWREHDPDGATGLPAIDFRTHDVVAVFAGSRPTGGFTVRILEVRRVGASAIVRAVIEKPGPGSIVTQAFTQPFAMKASAKLPARVRFQVREVERGRDSRRQDARQSVGTRGPSRDQEGVMAVDEATKKRIDRWIKQKGLNPYGDPQGTMYLGGTPLFDERTGRTKDRYEYILERHPELRRGQ